MTLGKLFIVPRASVSSWPLVSAVEKPCRQDHTKPRVSHSTGHTVGGCSRNIGGINK